MRKGNEGHFALRLKGPGSKETADDVETTFGALGYKRVVREEYPS